MRNGACFFSSKTRRIFYCILHFGLHIMSLAFSRLPCVCWLAISLIPISFSVSMVGLGQNHSCLPQTHSQIQNTNTSFHALWQAFFRLPNAYIHHNAVWKSNFKCEKNSTFSLQASPMFKSKSSCGWHENINIATSRPTVDVLCMCVRVCMYLFVNVVFGKPKSAIC